MVLLGDIQKDLRVLNEIQALVLSGFEVFVLVPGVPARVEEADGTYSICTVGKSIGFINKLFGMANSFNFFDRYWQKEIEVFITNHNINILHAHDLYMGPAASVAGKKAGIPVVLDLHENFPAAVISYAWVHKFPQSLFAKPHKWKDKEEQILADADGLILLSEAYRDKLKGEYSFLKKKAIAVYPNVPDVAQLLKFSINPVSFKRRHFCFLYFGAIGKRRGLHTAAQGIQLLRTKGVECELLVIGHVHKNEKDYFESEVLLENVTHIPWIDISELRSYMQYCDVCISPILKNDQHDSGVANKIFQYMLYEKPLLVSNCIPQMELVSELGCGLSHHSEDVEDFAVKAKWMMDNPGELKAMGERGKEAVLTTYNLEKKGEEIVNLYDKLLDHQSK